MANFRKFKFGEGGSDYRKQQSKKNNYKVVDSWGRFGTSKWTKYFKTYDLAYKSCRDTGVGHTAVIYAKRGSSWKKQMIVKGVSW